MFTVDVQQQYNSNVKGSLGHSPQKRQQFADDEEPGDLFFFFGGGGGGGGWKIWNGPKFCVCVCVIMTVCVCCVF